MNNTIGTYIYINHICHIPLSIGKKLKSFRGIFPHFFFMKPYWELWNLKVSQKLLTSSFSNFKHEKTSLSMILQSLQALKNTETKILFKEKTADYFKMHMHQLYMCGYLQTGRSGGQSVQFYICCDTYPAYLEPHCSSPCFTSAFLCAAIETRYAVHRQQWYSSLSYLSVSGHKVLQLEQALKFTELECK